MGPLPAGATLPGCPRVADQATCAPDPGSRGGRGLPEPAGDGRRPVRYAADGRRLRPSPARDTRGGGRAGGRRLLGDRPGEGAGHPHLAVRCATEVSSVGIFCKDSEGELGVSACYHGTGPVGTPVTVGAVASAVKHTDSVQDIVFIPLPVGNPSPRVYARKGVRGRPAPSEAEPVTFDGAGTKRKVTTYIKSHDAGILRNRRTLQLKVQTPADTNSGDSGSALVDQDDRVA